MFQVCLFFILIIDPALLSFFLSFFYFFSLPFPFPSLLAFSPLSLSFSFSFSLSLSFPFSKYSIFSWEKNISVEVSYPLLGPLFEHTDDILTGYLAKLLSAEGIRLNFLEDKVGF